MTVPAVPHWARAAAAKATERKASLSKNMGRVASRNRPRRVFWRGWITGGAPRPGNMLRSAARSSAASARASCCCHSAGEERFGRSGLALPFHKQPGTLSPTVHSIAWY